MNYKLLFILIAFCGCIKPARVNVRVTKPILVVEGLLMTDSTPCKVSLSYSGTFNESGYVARNDINDAVIIIINDTNDSVQLTNLDNGNYFDIDRKMTGLVNHSYHLSIHLPNGDNYVSLPEKILPVPKNLEVDSVGTGISYDNKVLHGARVLVKVKDPANETNYYRWISNGYIPRKSFGVPCGFSGRCRMYCYQYFEDHSINIYSDQKVNGNEIRLQPVLTSPFYSYGKHFMEIKQLSLTRQAYQFWDQFIMQAQRTGNITDPLPSSLKGNIYNVINPDEFALGYFEVSDVFTKKIIIDPFFYYPYVMETPAFEFIVDGACEEVYPNAMKDEPQGWSTAPTYGVTIRFF